jgi:leucyl aminopeptidase
MEMPSNSIKSRVQATDKKVTAEILVVGISRSENLRSARSSKSSYQLHIESGDMAIDTEGLIDALLDMGVTGAADEVTKLPAQGYRLLVLTGLGKKAKTSLYPAEVLRRAAGAAARSLDGHESATFSLPYDSLEDLAAIAEGALLGSYTFHDFRGSTRGERKAALEKVELFTAKAKSKELSVLLDRAEIIADQVHLTRDLINTPPSHLTPDSFSKRLRSEAVKAGLKVEVLDQNQLKAKGYGGITAVGQGSANPPRLLHISYSPKSLTKKTKRLAFVGKGITFDTGGLALKPAQGMEAMKSDMSGAAAVTAAIIAIARLKLSVAVDAWAPVAENMVSDTATRPSDIITIYGGKTIEVLNPDAEGRLILADALVRAAEVGDKNGGLAGIVDVATLTGAQVVALGTRTSAVMTNNDGFRQRFLEVTERTGEQFWPMPLPEELRASLDSPVADMANIGERMGGMLVAGLFLREFVSPDLPWLHLDIAGPAFNEGKAHGYTPVGGTGVAVHSLVALAEATATA